ncbi:gag-pol polyprotein [Tanacetum coccineum]
MEVNTPVMNLILFGMQEGIKRQFTTEYTPQQNGVAERMSKTLLERARPMLATAILGKSFWAEAVNTACYVIKHSPSTAVELKTSMEMWTGKPVNYLHLYMFGSFVYVMYNSHDTTKLDPKSRKSLFLGYADGVKGYRLWDSTAHKVVVCRYVFFMKDKIQENEESDNTTRETTSIQMENQFQSNDSSEAVPQHEENETTESHAYGRFLHIQYSMDQMWSLAKPQGPFLQFSLSFYLLLCLALVVL